MDNNKMAKEFRILKIYAVISSIILMGVVFIAAQQATKKVKMGEIDVERINIVEPDGSYRLIISNKTSFPGLILKGKEIPHDRQTAGMIFFNDENTENGGLIFGGKKDKDGNRMSFGHLSFDAYEQDQVFTIDAGEENGKKRTGLAIIDRPDHSITEEIALVERLKKMTPEQQKAEMEKFQAGHVNPSKRLYLGRIEDGSVGLSLKDAQGRDRILISVAADGTPVIKFLDETGKVISQLPAK